MSSHWVSRIENYTQPFVTSSFLLLVVMASNLNSDGLHPVVASCYWELISQRSQSMGPEMTRCHSPGFHIDQLVRERERESILQMR